jgi:hypothetical protein
MFSEDETKDDLMLTTVFLEISIEEQFL